MRTTRLPILVVGILAALPLRAFGATPTYYTNRGAFEATLNVRVIDDYANAAYVFIQNNATMSGVLGETEYFTTGFDNHNIVQSSDTYCAGCNGSYRLIFTSTSVGNAQGVYGVGVDITANSTSLPYYAYITFADATTADIALPTGASFFGVNAPELIESIHFGLSGGGSTQSGSFVIDNLTIGNALGNCGNSVVEAGEVCDDGNTVNGDGCSANCMSDETCGNGVTDTPVGEMCDDGNTTDGDGCNATCTSDETCGNGFVDTPVGEMCDDGNTTDGDGCSADCQSDETCGNSFVDTAAGEVCDDGNTADGDGCSANCQSDETCGNGVVDTPVGEACDDGNTNYGDGCSSDCLSDETCGNGVLDDRVGEQCDDGNNIDGDGCQADCSEPPCGNGRLDEGEACDDGNTVDGDGCNATCTSTEICGNGVLDEQIGEACDDGLFNSDTFPNACRTNCQPPFCGDDVRDTDEECDDGLNNNDETGPCNRACMIIEDNNGSGGAASRGCGCARGTVADTGEFPPPLVLLLLFGLLLIRLRRRAP